MKTLLSFALIASILLNGCMATGGTTSSNTPPQEGQYTGIFIGAAVIGLGVAIVVLVSKSQQYRADEAKFHACVGKTKAEIYALYGPPDSIVDDGKGDGGTILEYTTVSATTDGDGDITTTKNRKMFYLNKDNIVISLSEDNR